MKQFMIGNLIISFICPFIQKCISLEINLDEMLLLFVEIPILYNKEYKRIINPVYAELKSILQDDEI